MVYGICMESEFNMNKSLFEVSGIVEGIKGKVFKKKIKAVDSFEANCLFKQGLPKSERRVSVIKIKKLEAKE